MADGLAGWFDEFLLARRSGKPSRHTERAWRADFAAISSEVAVVVDRAAEDLCLEDATARNLRHGFARFADAHSAASIARAWSTWNQFFSFLVAEDVLPGNPMAAVAKPKVPRRGPKPLQGEDSVERLLGFLANGGRRARDPWPERDLAFIATDLLTGCRLAELLSLNLGSIDGRAGERRLKVVGKGSKERFLPIEEPLERIIESYLESRRRRFAGERYSPTAPLFVDLRGQRMRVGGAQYLVEQCFRQAGIGASVPRGALVHALRHTFATRLAEGRGDGHRDPAAAGARLVEYEPGVHRRHRAGAAGGSTGQPDVPDARATHRPVADRH
jgi:integrase/recombinase XerD